MMYEFVADMVRSNVGNEGRPYFPFIFTLFVFLLFGNLLGLIPYSYTFTSQIVVTFVMAAFVFLALTVLALFKHGLHFFSFFVPAGAPKALIPFLIIIEVISYFVRPVSLSVRLFANMLAGHTMLKVFAGLAVMISGVGGAAMAGSVFPFVALIGLTGLEVLVAVLQAYVFTILTCMYLNDALHLH
jgi:F-type H+-transporting ATPase subunit a